jgi:hypothetical protein
MLEKFKQGSVSILPLSLNINRLEYIISMFLTMIVSTVFIFLSFFLIDWVSLIILEAKKIEPFLLQVFFYYMSSLLLSYIVITVFFIIKATPIKAITIGLITFLVGNSIDELIYFYKYSKDETIKSLIDYISYIFPNFSLFDIQTYVVNRISQNFLQIGIETTIYFLILTKLLITISYFKFKNQKVIPNDS